MSFKLAITTNAHVKPYHHPAFSFERFVDAENAASSAHARGHYEQDGVYLYVGPGTVYHVLSDEEIIAQHNDAAASAKSGGFVLPARYKVEGAWRVIVQLGGAQLPPFAYVDEKLADHAISSAIRNGLFSQTVKPDHDLFHISLAPGTLFMKMTAEQCDERLRSAQAAAIKMQQEREAQMQMIEAQQRGVDPRFTKPSIVLK